MAFMEKLVLENRGQRFIYRFVGILLYIAGITNFLSALSDNGISAIFNTIIDLIAGTAFVTLNFGTIRNSVEKLDDTLVIHWHNRIRKMIIPVTSVKEIKGDDYNIFIILKEGKPVKLSARGLEFDEHHAVVKFLRKTTGTEKEK